MPTEIFFFETLNNIKLYQPINIFHHFEMTAATVYVLDGAWTELVDDTTEQLSVSEQRPVLEPVPLRQLLAQHGEHPVQGGLLLRIVSLTKHLQVSGPVG